ncbi:redoxin domain-containing protein [Hydrogenophaga sp. PAMC20947]|uniref:redoxin domain-containing protein n=1 Tax=Hydrogenophaga sp. PAMC20947 TaxID=2565558 RepID=UPI00109E062A|nr:redoxin domain-containing protein [Hydrogenophaga sp. PAMC20947]QCB47281.1 redoxin domain-containing protein [Hydrogenophaga sp. PAMC20947]
MLQRRQFNALSLSALAVPAGLLATAGRVHAAGVGQAAPDFTLSDTSGKSVTLSSFKGKPVVLEWNNPGCPFVRKHYNGNMQALQKAFTTQGVIWLTINSTEKGSVDHMTAAQLERWMTTKGASPSATLMDIDGQVGRAYGARVTPHMYIVSAQGALVYAGGIDSIPSARAVDIEKATNYIRQGLDELLAGKPLSTPTSQPYGCSIKYEG